MNFKNYLAIDTSSRYLTVLAVKGDKKVLRHTPDCAMKHSVILMDEVDLALKEADLAPSECDFFAAVTGPGSFTGIRIGVSAIKGFALAADKPKLAVTSFDNIAYNVEGDNFYTVIDAAHGFYYVKGYGLAECRPSYQSAEYVEKLKYPLYGFEDLSLSGYHKTDVKNCLEKAVAGCLKKGVTPDISALYVRKSQAEEGRR